MVEYRAASYDDIPALLRDMREADRQEVTAASPDPLDDTLAQALWTSPDALAATDDEGALLALFGYAPVSTERAAIWLLGTTKITRHHSELARAGRAYTDEVLRTYPYLFNYVDARNSASKVWLRRIGFILQPAVPHGPFGLPFHPFYRKA